VQRPSGKDPAEAPSERGFHHVQHPEHEQRRGRTVRIATMAIGAVFLLVGILGTVPGITP
jgi:hypothetical protein